MVAIREIAMEQASLKFVEGAERAESWEAPVTTHHLSRAERYALGKTLSAVAVTPSQVSRVKRLNDALRELENQCEVTPVANASMPRKKNETGVALGKRSRGVRLECRGSADADGRSDRKHC